MDLVLIDYSADEEQTAPRRSGKFVQVRKGRKEYIVLSTKLLAPYHANICERFFAAQGVKGTYNRKRDHYRVDEAGWTVLGGGAWEMDGKARTIRLGGESLAYGAFRRQGLRERLQRSLPGYTVHIT